MKARLRILLSKQAFPYLIGIFLIFVTFLMGLVWFVCRLPASPLERVTLSGNDSKRMAHGEYLTRLSDCAACHSVPGKAPFSGGLKMETPLGAVFSTNITPDPEFGIGMYTLADFDRAVRAGVGHDGHRLYPAMPYPSYAKLTDEDVEDLYVFFRDAVKPVHLPNPKNEIPFLLNIRWPLSFWNLMFVPHHPYQENKSQTAQWNRGAYLVEGAGHCGACHTPRNLITVNEKGLDASSKSFLAGATIENWYAPSLRNDANTGIGRWSENEIFEFLKEGHNAHSVVFGSMAEVYNNSTQFMRDEDLQAMAHYLKSLPGTAKGNEHAWHYQLKKSSNTKGQALYLQKCASCHGEEGLGKTPWIPPLAGATSAIVNEKNSSMNITLNGSPRVIAHDIPDPYRMPAFRNQLKDEEVADLLSYIRSSWGNQANAVSAKEVAKIRKATAPANPNPVVLQIK